VISNLDLKLLHQNMRDELVAAACRVIDSGMYLLGNELTTFERGYAAYCGSKESVGVANGLDALILVLQAWMEQERLHQGDHILVPANTFYATVLAVSSVGLVPIPVEPDPATHNIDTSRIEAAISAKVKGIIPVHLYGRAVDMSEVMRIANAHNLLVLEDAAQAHGAYWNDQRTGTLGHAAGFSLYPGKNLGALGDSGVITTNDTELADILRSLRNYGSGKKYYYDYQGRNSRMDEIQAAFLTVKLRHLDQETSKRREIAARYLAEIDRTIVSLPDPGKEGQHVWHQFVVTSKDRTRLIEHLAGYGVHPIIHYPVAPHKQVAFKNMNNLELPIAEALAETVLSLPVHSGLTEDEVTQIITAVNGFRPNSL